jgi:hypothetical protein
VPKADRDEVRRVVRQVAELWPSDALKREKRGWSRWVATSSQPFRMRPASFRSMV